MRLLIIDRDGTGLDLAFRSVQHGHEVQWFLPPDGDYIKRSGEGFKGIERIDDWRAGMEWAELVFPTGNDKYMASLDTYRDHGAPIFGPNQASTRLEIDREYGMEVMRAHGLPVPEYESFTDFDAAIRYVKAHDQPFVSKPFNSRNKELSYVAKSPEDLVYMLERWQKLGTNLGPFMLQRKIEGTEFAVSMWMGKDGWIGAPDENFEHKKLLAGGLGVNTGETGTVLKYVTKSKLFDILLAPLEAYLRSIGHLGDIDVNCIVDADGTPWPLEFTARPGWPAFFIQTARHKGDPIQWMADALEGKDSLKLDYGHAVGVVLWMPNFPYRDDNRAQNEGTPIYGAEDVLDDLHFADVMMAKAPSNRDGMVVDEVRYCTSGNYVLVATGLGKSVLKARDKAYGTLAGIDLPGDPGWRIDIGGEKTRTGIKALQKHGYAREWTYQ